MRFASKGMRFSAVGAVFAVLFAASLGCNRPKSTAEDPSSLLRDYISESFSVQTVKDRDSLLRYLTGAAKNRLAAWSDEQFHDAFIKNRREMIKFEIIEKKESGADGAGITYQLTYFDNKEAKVIHKKVAQLSRREGRWYIAEVRNLKEMIEYKNEMSLP